MSDKSELRNKYRIKRKYFPRSAREAADGAICDRVLAELGGYESFFIYYSFNAEADTHTIIDKLLAQNKRVYLPKMEGQDIIPVAYYGKADELIKNPYGIYEPSGEQTGEDIEVCITPLLAINPEGYRLGYGGGYYDRFFAAHAGILKVGLGYFAQIAQDFIQDKWDEPLDKFICERGIIDFGKRF